MNKRRSKQHELKQKRFRHARSELGPSPEDEDDESEDAEGQPVGSTGDPREFPMVEDEEDEEADPEKIEIKESLSEMFRAQGGLSDVSSGFDDSSLRGPEEDEKEGQRAASSGDPLGRPAELESIEGPRCQGETGPEAQVQAKGAGTAGQEADCP